MAQMGGNVILAPLAARNPMVEDLDGNGFAILDLDRVETNALLGTISEEEIQQLDGAGLFVDDDGRLSVNSDVFEGDIDGLSNPLTEDLDAAGYNIDNAGSVSTEVIGTDYHYAGGYDGSGPDARLDNALSAANRGDRILLENATYSDNRTIEDRHNLSGTGMRNGTEITGSWDIGTSQLDHVRLSDVGITSGGFNVISHFSGNTGSSITVTGDRSVIGPAFGGNMSVIFESGTSNNIIDSVAEVAVTDNGSNTVGDIS